MCILCMSLCKRLTSRRQYVAIEVQPPRADKCRAPHIVCTSYNDADLASARPRSVLDGLQVVPEAVVSMACPAMVAAFAVP